MSRFKSSLARSVPATDTVSTDARFVSTHTDAAPKLTTDLSQVDAMPSPALDLQQNLRTAWTTPNAAAETAPDTGKIPVGWALAAVVVGCGAFWACVAAIVF